MTTQVSACSGIDRTASESPSVHLPSGRSGRFLEVRLRCDICGAAINLQPWYRLTKSDVFRLEGSAGGFLINGGHVRCAEHSGEFRDGHPQRDTWGAYDRRSVEDEQAHEQELDEVVRRYPELERRA